MYKYAPQFLAVFRSSIKDYCKLKLMGGRLVAASNSNLISLPVHEAREEGANLRDGIIGGWEEGKERRKGEEGGDDE